VKKTTLARISGQEASHRLFTSSTHVKPCWTLIPLPVPRFTGSGQPVTKRAMPRHQRYFSGLLLILCLTAWGCATGGKALAPVARPVLADFPDQGHQHLPHPHFPHAAYNSNPGTSGPHTSYTAPWGVHRQPVPDEVAIHNLEHGGVVLGYRCKDCPDTVAALTRLTEAYRITIVAPNPRLDAPVVLSAWRHTLSLPRLDEAGLAAARTFLERHHGVDHHPRGPHPHSMSPAEADRP
jgi:hypothetical protein